MVLEISGLLVRDRRSAARRRVRECLQSSESVGRETSLEGERLMASALTPLRRKRGPSLPMPCSYRMSARFNNLVVGFLHRNLQFAKSALGPKRCLNPAGLSQPASRDFEPETASDGETACRAVISVYDRDRRERDGIRRKLLRTLAILRPIRRCLSDSARQNPTVANFATVGFQW